MKRARFKLAVLALLCVLAPVGRGAELIPEKHDWDFTLKLGATSGTVSKTDVTTKIVTEYGYGGLPFVIALNNDLGRSITLFGEIHMIVDPINIQVTRTGFDLGVALHLFGGARRLVEEFGELGIIRREPYNISLLVRGGLHRYVASSGSNSLSGNLFDTMIGAQARFDVDEKSSLSFELYSTAFTLAGSLDGLAARQLMFLFGWRFFL